MYVAAQGVYTYRGGCCNGSHDYVLGNGTRRVQGRVTSTLDK
jgi:hypothetical protein